MTKREFKDRSSVHVYGRGERRRVALFFDWKSDHKNNAVGFKYMIKGFGCTQARILADAYDIIILDEKDSLMWYDTKEAETEQDRFKVPLSM